ncbi:MAG TPA: peptidylprolyl isomerase [Blastocatellia bacterium]|nr:peptidylprolyl isomerase [Blastocatellia bacterium]
MRARSVLPMAALLFVGLGSLSCGRNTALDDEVAVMETNYGRIVIEFFPKYAPKHVDNFKTLAEQGFYDGTRIHRVVKDKSGRAIAVQGGDPNTINGDPSTWGRGQPAQPTVDAEFSTNLKHERGIVSAARKPELNSATSQFFICVAPMPQFDGNYSIFGKVIEGMNVVDSIARAPLWPNTERPVDPVVVSKAYLVKRTALH